MNVRALRFAGASLIVLFGVWAGLRVYSSHTPTIAAPAVVRVPVGEASAPTPSDIESEADTLPPPKIPQMLPEFTLGDRAGKPMRVSTWRGKSLILNFWATWCAPCRREIPLLESLHGQWAARGVEVVGVAVDYRDKVIPYADEMKITYPLLIGEQDALDVAAKLGVESPVFPFTVFTDARGEVVTLILGELHPPQAALILAVVETLNRSSLPLPEARRRIAEGLHKLQAKSGV